MPKLKLLNREDIRSAIQRRGNEIAETLSDRDVFQSPEFEHYATKLVDFILRNKKFFRLKLIHDESTNGVTAFTDGRNITANTGNILVKAAECLEQRFKSAMGLIFHEVGHMLFMNFDLTASALNQIQSGELFGEFPVTGNEALSTAYSELKDVVSSPYAKLVARLYQELMNIINDGHDESAIRRCFPGFITECIDAMDAVQWQLSPTLEESIACGAAPFQIIIQLLLDYSLFRQYKSVGSSPETDRYLETMNRVQSTLDHALSADDVAGRWNWVNLLVLQLWPFIRDLFRSESPEQSGSDDGSSDMDENEGKDDSGGTSAGYCTPLTPDELEQMLQEIFEQVETAHSVAPSPENGSGTGIDASTLVPCTQSIGNRQDLHSLVRQLSEKLAEQAIQKELDDAQMEALRNANYPLIHRHTQLDVKRHFEPYQSSYDAILNRVKPFLKNMIQSTRLLVEELNDDCVQKHRHFGPIVQATESYRPDGTYFAKRKIPDDVPDMAICILIDCSGSMEGKKLNYSMETAILMERYANALNIPIMIATHNVTLKGHVNLHIYTDYVSAIPDKDRYALAGITSRGRNRDGLPIRACCELLSKRPEEVKLMIVLSDGAPNDGVGYKGEAAREDIRSIVKEFRRKGLLIFGAAIDKDRKIIESIYGDTFLSIENLASLPKTLIRIIKQKLT